MICFYSDAKKIRLPCCYFTSFEIKIARKGLPSTNAVGFWGNFKCFVIKITKKILLICPSEQKLIIKYN